MHNTEPSLVCKVLGQSSTQLDAIRPTWVSLPINRACTPKQLLASLPGYLSAASAQLLGLLPGTTTPTHTPNSSGVPTTPGAYRCRAHSKQEICVVFQTNPTETRITTTLSQSVACQNLPETKQLCSWTLKFLPEVQCYGEHTFCQGNKHSQQNCKNTQKHGEYKILYYSRGKKICTLQWKPRREMRDEFLQANSQSCYRPDSYN